jgi:hypothetical protein
MWVSVASLAAMVAKCTGMPAPRLLIPMSLARVGLPFTWLFTRRGSRPLYSAVSLHALAIDASAMTAPADLGYQPRPIEETIDDTLEVV